MAEISTYRFDGLDFFADLGADVIPALDNLLGLVKDKPAEYLSRMGHTLLDTAIVTRMKEAGTSDQKALASRLQSHVGDLMKFQGSASDTPLGQFVRQDIRQVIQAGVKLGMADEAQQFLEYAADVAGEALKQAEKATPALPVAVMAPEPPAAAPAPGSYQPPRGSVQPKGGFLQTIKDNWIPLTILGVGGVLALTIALVDRPKPAMAGLGRFRSRRRRHRR
jgi:hypothetical protein